MDDKMEVEVPPYNPSVVLPDLGLPVEDQSVFVWHITNWEEVRTLEKIHGPEFTCGGYRWRILLFPKGNRGPDALSVFIESLDAATMPKNSPWHICLQFALAIQNVEDPTVFKHMSANHRFSPGETDWGFNHLVRIKSLLHVDETSRPLVEKNQVNLLAYMKIIKDETGVLWHNFIDYDSKKETGFVGLKNQGATCYMNSLLQSLYFTGDFRRATFEIPTENDEPTKSIPLALQRLFYNLQYSDKPAGTTELTKSFGWDTVDSFMQHDVQEFNRVLQDALEKKMKGTKAEGAISKLFVGKMKSYIKCINVDYESSRVEDFYDIQLNVKGCKDLKESFIDYCQVETLEGENKYHSEKYGLQDAKKGVIFKKFPPVLHLQLKRFEYDMQTFHMVKINDRHEFPLDIDLTDFLETPDDKAEKACYSLHGVLVHSGDLQSGHYCAFIRPEKNGKWFKFDDDRVIPVTVKEALEDNYGGSVTPDANTKLAKIKRFTNAYMLVYVKTSEIDRILEPLTPQDIPSHLRCRLEKEKKQDEQRRKETEEMHLYLTVRVITDGDIAKKHNGFDLCNFEEPKSVNPAGVGLCSADIATFKVKKSDTYSSFLELLAARYNTSPKLLRVWNMVVRQNKTIRPDAPLFDDGSKTMEQIRDRLLKSQVSELKFYVEVLSNEIEAQKEPDSTIVTLFLKYYNPFTQTIEYVGNTSISRSAKVGDLVPTMLERKRLPTSTTLRIYEEVKPAMIDLMKHTKSLQNAELSDGDILCYQQELTEQELDSLPDKSLAYMPEYFDLLNNRLTVTFKEKPKETDIMIKENSKEISIDLSKKMNYDTVVTKLAQKIDPKLDPFKIRLYTSGPNGIPKNAIRKHSNATLAEMLSLSALYNLSFNAVCFYEILDVSITELETKRFIKVLFVDKNMREIGPFELLVSKTGKVKELCDAVSQKLHMDQTKKLVRILEIFNFKIHKVYDDEEMISSIPEFNVVIAEEVPMEELHLAQGNKVVQVVHYNRDAYRLHGIPFRFVVKAGETVADAKQRMAQRLGVSDKDFNRSYKLTVIKPDSKVVLLKDEDILDKELKNMDLLGLDHPDRKAALSSFDRPIKILS